MSPRTTAASVAFSKAITSATAGTFGACRAQACPVGRGSVQGRSSAATWNRVADCADRPSTSTRRRERRTSEARASHPPDHEVGGMRYAARALAYCLLPTVYCCDRVLPTSPAFRYASKINDTARAQSRAVAGGGSPRPIRSRHSLHDSRPATQIAFGGTPGLVASRTDDLHTLAARGRRTQKRLLCRQLSFLVPAAPRVGVARFVEEHHTARRTQRDVRIVLDLAFMYRVTGHGGHDLRLFRSE